MTMGNDGKLAWVGQETFHRTGNPEDNKKLRKKTTKQNTAFMRILPLSAGLTPLLALGTSFPKLSLAGAIMVSHVDCRITEL
jgi:hypothetical protein